MSSDIYLFLSDEAFASVKTATVVKYADISQTGIGMLDDNLLNYFIDHSIFLDPISSGQSERRQSRCNVDDSSQGSVPNGRMMMHFDADKLLNNTNSTFSKELVSGFVVNQNDDAGYATAKRERLCALFNIVDTIFYARDSEGEPKNASAIEAILTNAGQADSTYLGYVPNSLFISTTKSIATSRMSGMGNPISDQRYYWDSCSFSYKFTDADNVPVEIVFHIWLNSDQFKANYPYSTIVDCIYPCSPKWIMNPELYANQTRAILTSSNYKNEMIKEAVTYRDHSGVTLMSSRYVAEYADELPMSFALLYKGAVPTTAQARAYIKQRLLSETDDDGHSWSVDEWRSRLPDLFIDGSYYLVPIYSQREVLPDSTTAIEKSCVNYQKIFSIAKAVLGTMGMDDASLMSNIDILQAPGHSIYIVGIPLDPANQLSMHELHPTYSSTDAISESFDAMSPGDRDFAEKIASALAVCMKLTDGGTEAANYTDSTIGSRPAKAFTAGDSFNNTNMEYIMLEYDKDDTIWS